MMPFQDAVRTCFEKYIVISGRAQRSEYWWFALFTTVSNIVLGGFDSMLFGQEFGALQGLFSLLTFLPSICVGGRRLHDRDMSAWWLLVILIPFLGWLFLLVLFILPGTEGPNRFGPDPLGGHKPEDLPDDFIQSSIPRTGKDD